MTKIFLHSQGATQLKVRVSKDDVEKYFKEQAKRRERRASLGDKPRTSPQAFASTLRTFQTKPVPLKKPRHRPQPQPSTQAQPQPSTSSGPPPAAPQEPPEDSPSDEDPEKKKTPKKRTFPPQKPRPFVPFHAAPADSFEAKQSETAKQDDDDGKFHGRPSRLDKKAYNLHTPLTNLNYWGRTHDLYVTWCHNRVSSKLS